MEIVMEYTKINEHIYRAVIPYKDIFTTVYTVQYDGGAVLFDTATYESDVTDYIVPMLESLGIDENTLKCTFGSPTPTTTTANASPAKK